MKISTAPPRGMRDILPLETEIRDFVSERILKTYGRFGFRHIETPALESLDLLTGSEGGENEKLIFRILRRGERLDLAKADLTADDLTDLGLRFDLTVPLARYYANNRNALPRVFKAIQLGPVWRAERPQRGRFRQFTQCDIDVIGVAGEIAEVELLIATSEALLDIGFRDFTIRLNDRRLLNEIAAHCGFADADFTDVFITLDKLDKIGLDGVRAELESGPYPQESTARILAILAGLPTDLADETAVRATLPPDLTTARHDGVATVMAAVRAAAAGRYGIVFDPALVRGMGYYTGQIFEIQYKDYGFSIAGGGRYDKMIGRIIGEDVPACGFSIGFERVVSILLEERMAAADDAKRLAVLIGEDDPLDLAVQAAAAFREEGYAASLVPRQKRMGKQLKRLLEDGYTCFCVFRPDAAEQKVEPLQAS